MKKLKKKKVVFNTNVHQEDRVISFFLVSAHLSPEEEEEDKSV